MIPSWIAKPLAIIAGLGIIQVLIAAYNEYQQRKGKQEAEAEQNKGELDALKRENKRNEEVEHANRNMPRSELYKRLRDYYDKNGK